MGVQVNFASLPMQTLRRYKKHYKSPGNRLEMETSGKPELVDLVTEHFRQQSVDEMDTVVLFCHCIKSNKSTRDRDGR